MKIKNPKIKINSDVDLYEMYVLDNSNVVLYPTISGLFEVVSLRQQDESFCAYISSDYVFEVEDLVNCTYDFDGECVVVTDPSKDASCTIRVGGPA